MQNKYNSILAYLKSHLPQFFLFLGLLLSINGSLIAQQIRGVDYISPKPGSKGNSLETNIIIRFNKPIDKLVDYKNHFKIQGKQGFIPFHIVEQNDHKKLILKADELFTILTKIEVSCLQAINTENGGSIMPFQFFFWTNKEKEFEYVLNEPELLKRKEIMASKVEIEVAGAPGDRTIQTDFQNQLPFHMTTKSNDSNEYYFIGSMLSPGNKDRLMIVNGKGEMVYERRTPFMTMDFKMHHDTTFSFCNVSNIPSVTSFIILDKNFNDIDTIQAGNGYLTDIHELIKDPRTGHYYLLAQRTVNVDMLQLLPNGKPNAQVLDIIIQEIDENGVVLFEWKCLDYLPIMDSYGLDLTSYGPIDYVHCNAISLDSDTTLLLSSRHLCEITRIDRRTGKIIWRLGPKASTDNFYFINDPGAFTYQHDASRLPNGNILLFDNRNLKPGLRYSRVVEYRLDEISLTAERVWEYRHTPDIIADFMGGVKRYPNGNTLIAWGAGTPTFTEIDSLSETVCEATFPSNILNYRAFKYKIPNLIQEQQPKFTLPNNYSFCKLKDHNFENNLKLYVQPFVQNNIPLDFQSYKLVNNKLDVVLLDTLTRFYNYYQKDLVFKSVELGQKDTTICEGKGLIKISVIDNCSNSSYLWNTGATTPTINYNTTDYKNTIWLKTTNAGQVQVDTLAINVSPVGSYEIIGQPLVTSPFQIFTYSAPYYKGAVYDWKAINGNIIGGFDGNSVQVQWADKEKSYLSTKITDLYGCVNGSPWDTITYQKSTTGLADLLEKTGVNVYPSPFKNQITLTGTNRFSYVLYDLKGTAVIRSDDSFIGEHHIETGNLVQGIYILSIMANEHNVQVKLLKE